MGPAVERELREHTAADAALERWLDNIRRGLAHHAQPSTRERILAAKTEAEVKDAWVAFNAAAADPKGKGASASTVRKIAQVAQRKLEALRAEPVA